MSKFVAFLTCIMFVALTIFHQGVEAGPNKAQDRNRAVTAFNFRTDACHRISADFGLEAKAAADLLCKQAFEALDRLEGNECKDWYEPECRKFPEHLMYTCSCKIPPPENSKVGGPRFLTFNDCARDLKQEEARNKKIPAPSAGYKHRHDKIQRTAENKKNAWRTGKTASEVESSDSETPEYFRRNYGRIACQNTFDYFLKPNKGKKPSRKPSRDPEDSSSDPQDSSDDPEHSSDDPEDSSGNKADFGKKGAWSAGKEVGAPSGKLTSRNKATSTGSSAEGGSKERQKKKGKRRE